MNKNICTVSHLIFSLRSEYQLLEKKLKDLQEQTHLSDEVEDMNFYITESWNENKPEMNIEYKRLLLKRKLLKTKITKSLHQGVIDISEIDRKYLFADGLAYGNIDFYKKLNEIMNSSFVNNISWSLSVNSSRKNYKCSYDFEIQQNGISLVYRDNNIQFTSGYDSKNDEVYCQGQSPMNKEVAMKKSLGLEIPLGILPEYHQTLLAKNTDNYELILKDKKTTSAIYGVVKR